MSVDQRQCLTTAQFPGRCLGDHPRFEHNHVARPDIDLGYHLVGHSLLDPTNIGAVLPTVGLHGDSEWPCTCR
jgi:hypothetical protein